jgi:hypothetical protein
MQRWLMKVDPTTTSVTDIAVDGKGVSQIRTLPFRVAHGCRGECDPHPSLPRIQHSLRRAALLAGGQVQDHAQLADVLEAVPAPAPRAELQRRANIQFSGISGAVVASSSQGQTSAQTYQLVDDAINRAVLMSGRL